MIISTAQESSAGSDMDLSEFYPIFFEEAGENLERMEQQLLGIDIASADDETLNSIFRCAHSVKGGAATFGFADVAELTHQMETLLDKLRRHELAPTTSMVDALLQASDALRAQLARHQNGGTEPPVDTSAVLARIAALLEGEAPAPAVPPAAPVATPAPAAAAGQLRTLELAIGPFETPEQADALAAQLGQIADLGSLEPLAGNDPADGLRHFKLITRHDDDELADLLSFHVAREQVRLLPFQAAKAPAPAADFGFFEGAPGAPGASPEPPQASVETAAPAGPQASSHGFFEGAPGAPGAAPAAPAEATTLRVSVEKVDQLINLVGELVITQAMLAQNSAHIDPALQQQLAAGLADLERNTRNLQEAVMSIRMIPMSVVFNRFPRMLRDLAAKLGKKVDFVTQGEATELDKGLVEKITDPLTHLVRNSCDHGIESPAERLAKGKRETGTITLAASHQGGSIVIEVRDDGRGLSRDKLLHKARERGIDVPDSLPDAEVWQLIFAPGFSTAQAVTDVSGRGVGMDVVKKNITALGGSVEIESAEGYGMSVKVRLPLTLAIMDSMSLGVGGECYILPLSSVVESFQLAEGRLKSIGNSARLVQVRDEYLPVIDLERVFEVPRTGDAPANPIMVVVEADGARAALRVDELLGQQQVVVKNLEANYRRVDHISGATIMGDGRVALIIDVGSLVRRSRH